MALQNTTRKVTPATSGKFRDLNQAATFHGGRCRAHSNRSRTSTNRVSIPARPMPLSDKARERSCGRTSATVNSPATVPVSRAQALMRSHLSRGTIGGRINPCARETGTVAGEFTVAEVRPQLLSRALSDSGMGRAGMDTRLLMSGFGWNGLGIALHGTWPLIQVAEFTGVAGVTFLVVFCNAILTTTARRIWEETRSRAMRPHFDLNSHVGWAGGGVCLGRRRGAKRVPVSRSLHVALVQANAHAQEKFDLRYKSDNLDKFARLNKIALPPHPISTCWSGPRAPCRRRFSKIRKHLILSARLPVRIRLIYCSARSRKDGSGLQRRSAGFRPQTNRNFTAKFTLVPFGEFVPFRHSSHSSRNCG